jgi:hypothetical protein
MLCLERMKGEWQGSWAQRGQAAQHGALDAVQPAGLRAFVDRGMSVLALP